MRCHDGRVSSPAQQDLARGLAALVVTAVEVGHGELEARRQVGAFLRALGLDPVPVLRAAVGAVVDLAPAEMSAATSGWPQRGSAERQLLAALEARDWLEHMSADVLRGEPL